MTRETEGMELSVLVRAAREGRLQGGSPFLLTVTLDFLKGLYDSLVSPDEALYQVGWGWGRAWLARMDESAAQYHALATDLPFEDMVRVLEDHLARTGWGRVEIDLERFSKSGLIPVTVSAGPVSILDEPVSGGVACLLAGFLAGVFAAFFELPMEGLGGRHERAGSNVGQIIVGHQPRIARLRSLLERGEDWWDLLEGSE